MVTILMTPTKLATSSLVRIKIFRTKGFGVIISDYYVTNKILPRDSNYTVDVVM